MRLVHHRDGGARPPTADEAGTTDEEGNADGVERRVLADEVELAEGPLAQALGLMFRRSIPEGYALAFPFEAPASRTIHTLFVFRPIDVLWLVDDEVVNVERLRPFRGLAHGLADTVVELPAGDAAGVEPGGTVEIVA
ncbi:DUF192 domain-containing protein [Halolamina salina]|uniref:DUF192 domain-containing protein n=1 Tax=Halolamina salina TaxID=1220023 RepID=A0ABD6BAA0_9EURY